MYESLKERNVLSQISDVSNTPVTRVAESTTKSGHSDDYSCHS